MITIDTNKQSSIVCQEEVGFATDGKPVPKLIRVGNSPTGQNGNAWALATGVHYSLNLTPSIAKETLGADHISANITVRGSLVKLDEMGKAIFRVGKARVEPVTETGESTTLPTNWFTDGKKVYELSEVQVETDDTVNLCSFKAVWSVIPRIGGDEPVLNLVASTNCPTTKVDRPGTTGGTSSFVNWKCLPGLESTIQFPIVNHTKLGSENLTAFVNGIPSSKSTQKGEAITKQVINIKAEDAATGEDPFVQTATAV